MKNMELLFFVKYVYVYVFVQLTYSETSLVSLKLSPAAGNIMVDLNFIDYLQLVQLVIFVLIAL